MPPDPDDLTDESIARSFVNLHSDKLRYCPTWKAWLVYDGMRWYKDDTLEPVRLAQKYVQSLRDHLPRLSGRSERDEFLSAIRRAEHSRTPTAILKSAQSDDRVVVRPADFDQNQYVLNCRNGTIDLTTGELNRHGPGDNLTKLAPVEFLPSATCPTWDAFLSRIMAGDNELIGFLRRAAGYALTGDASGNCFFLLHGHGRNGKTVLVNALLHVLGDYGMTAANNLLTSANRQHPTALADLHGKRLVGISEPNDGRFDEALVKWLTGGDTIRARRVHCDSFEFSPTFKFFMSSNHMPEVREMGEAMWRRIRVIPFTVTILPEEEDTGLAGKIRAEASGILNWMLKGCLEWRVQGLMPPESVNRATKDYREEMDSVGEFINARCILGPDLRVPTNELLRAFAEWCDQTGVAQNERVGTKEFSQRLEQKGFKGDRTSTTRWRLGVALKPTAKPTADKPT